MPERTPSPEEQVGHRIDELTSKTMLATSRLSDAIEGLKITEDQRLPADELIDAEQYSMKVSVDAYWVKAMVRANVPFETILKVWDIKDQIEREQKDTTSTQ